MSSKPQNTGKCITQDPGRTQHTTYAQINNIGNLNTVQRYQEAIVFSSAPKVSK